LQTKNETPKPLTVVFVDYESWFWGLRDYGLSPDLKEFVQDVKQVGNLEQIYFFADFAKPDLEPERFKLRTITTNIIDCSHPDNKSKKDYTDFIMLDHIYRTIIQRPEIMQYVLVTGDGHFHNVVAFLTTFMDKTVGVYGVHGSFSAQLRECATWFKVIGTERTVEYRYREVLATLNVARLKKLDPTFGTTVGRCSEYYRIDRAAVAMTLSKLIDEGYIKQTIIHSENGDRMILITDWQCLKEKGLWKSD